MGGVMTLQNALLRVGNSLAHLFSFLKSLLVTFSIKEKNRALHFACGLTQKRHATFAETLHRVGERGGLMLATILDMSAATKNRLCLPGLRKRVDASCSEHLRPLRIVLPTRGAIFFCLEAQRSSVENEPANQV